MMKRLFLSSMFAIGMIATALMTGCDKKEDPIAVASVQLSKNQIVIVGGGYSHFNGYHLARKCR